MQVSLILAEEIVMLFLIMAMGTIIVRRGLIKANESRSVSVILVYIVIPCVIINAFQIKYDDHVRDGLILAFAMSILIHILFLIATYLLKKPLNLDAIEKATIIYPNAGILVIPLINALLGPEYVIYSCGFVVIQLILIWTHCRKMLCEEETFSIREILLNINIVAIIIGAGLFLLHIQLPQIIIGTLDMTGVMIGPLGMLLAGMVIAEKPLAKLFTTTRNYLSTFIRLIICPLLVLALFILTNAAGFVDDGKNILMTVYLASITPACATITSMAQLYKKDAVHASALYVVSTIFSIITMPIMIGLFDYFIK